MAKNPILNLYDLKRCIKYASARAERSKCFMVAARLNYGSIKLEDIDINDIMLKAVQAGSQCGIFCASERVFFKEQA